MSNKLISNSMEIKENEIRRKHEYIRGNKDRQTCDKCKRFGNIKGSRYPRSNFICKFIYARIFILNMYLK